MLTLLFCGALALFNVALISFVLFLVGISLEGGLWCAAKIRVLTLMASVRQVL